MRLSCRPAAWLALAIFASLAIRSWRPAPPGLPPRPDAAAHAPRPRSDDPDAAHEYDRQRRLRPGSTIDAPAAYRAAAMRVSRLPVHSIRLGGLVAGSEHTTVGAAAATDHQLGAWTPLGPGNIGGRTRVLAIDPRDGDSMLAAGVSGGLWRSTDGGASWRPVGDDLVNLAVNSLAMDPGHPDVLYAGTGEGYFREVVRGTGLPLRGGGVFRTADFGETWTLLPSTTTSDFLWVNDLVVSPHDSARLYAATRTGVWRSSDGGGSWRRILDPVANGGCLDLAVRTDLPTDALLASCGTLAPAAVYSNGRAELDEPWSQVLAETGMGRTSLAIAPSDQRVVYALAAANAGGPGGRFEQGLYAVFRSTGGGARGTWAAMLRNTSSRWPDVLLLTNPIAASYRACQLDTADVIVNMGWYANVIAVDPVAPSRVWAAGVDLFRSDDNGRTWGVASYWWTSPTDTSFVHADQHGIVFHPGYDGAANRTLFVVNDGGVYRTDDATAPVGTGSLVLCNPQRSLVRWTALNHGYGVTQFYHGAPFPDGRAVLGGTQDNGTLLGRDGAGPDGWLPILGGDGGYVAVDPRDPQVIYAEAQGFDLYRSSDGGQTFKPAVEGVGDPPRDFLFITPFLLDPAAPDRLWAGGRRLWRSDDGAEHWVAASAPLADGGKVSALAVAPGDPDTVLAGTSAGTIYRASAATTASAATVWPGSRPRAGFVTSLAFDPTAERVVYATYGDFGGSHVWRSGDAGVSWEAIDGSGPSGLPDLPVHVLVVDPDRPGRLFLGTDLGVLVSTTAGHAWAAENTGFANAVTEALSLLPAADGGGRTLFAFTHGRGAWKVPLPAPAAPARPLRRRLTR